MHLGCERRKIQKHSGKRSHREQPETDGRLILGKLVVRVGDVCNWFRIVFIN
jgi:hypothetical protein